MISLKLIFQPKRFKNYLSFLLMFFSISNLLVSKVDANQHLIRRRQEDNKLMEPYNQNAIEYSQHDSTENQLKMFFGLDTENPETSFYPDLLISDYSDYVRDMYKLKLNDITIK